MMDRDTELTAGSCRWNRPRAALLVLVAMSLAAVPSAQAVEAQEISQEGGVVAWTAQVRDATSNEALLGAVIELGGMVRRYVTDVDGRAVMDVPRGRYKVTVRRWGYDKLAGDLEVIRSGELMLEMHRTSNVDLDAPGRLLVRVVNGESGDPIEGALVSLPEGGSRVTDRSGQRSSKACGSLWPGLRWRHPATASARRLLRCARTGPPL